MPVCLLQTCAGRGLRRVQDHHAQQEVPQLQGHQGRPQTTRALGLVGQGGVGWGGAGRGGAGRGGAGRGGGAGRAGRGRSGQGSQCVGDHSGQVLVITTKYWIDAKGHRDLS